MTQGAPYAPQGSSPHLRLKLQGDLEPSQSTLQHLLGCPSGSRGKQFSWMLLAFPFYHLQTISLESRVVCATCTRILYGRQLSRTVSRVAISPLPKMDGFYRPHNSRSKLRRLSSVSTRPTQLPVQTALIASWTLSWWGWPCRGIDSLWLVACHGSSRPSSSLLYLNLWMLPRANVPWKECRSHGRSRYCSFHNYPGISQRSCYRYCWSLSFALVTRPFDCRTLLGSSCTWRQVGAHCQSRTRSDARLRWIAVPTSLSFSLQAQSFQFT